MPGGAHRCSLREIHFPTIHVWRPKRTRDISVEFAGRPPETGMSEHYLAVLPCLILGDLNEVLLALHRGFLLDLLESFGGES